MLTDKTNILAKYLKGECTADEIGQIENWLAKDLNRKKEFEAYKTLWEKSGDIYLHETTDLHAAWERIDNRMETSENPEKKVKIINFHKNFRIAAVVILLIGISGLLFMLNNKIINRGNQFVEIHSGNSIKEVTLTDGSIITLNYNSVLKYPEKFGKKHRTVRFSGEGYFKVAKNDKKPFVISIDNYQVQVLGTEFTINSKTTNNNIEVVVYEGKVAFYDEGNKNNKLVLNKDEKGIAIPEEGKLVKTENTDFNNISWKTGEVIFENSTIQEICSILSKHYHKQVEYITNQHNEEVVLTASFENQELEEVLDVICLTLDLNYTFNEEKVVIE